MAPQTAGRPGLHRVDESRVAAKAAAAPLHLVRGLACFARRFAFALVVGLCSPTQAGPPRHETPLSSSGHAVPTLTLREAVFDTPSHPAVTVALPDTWALRGLRDREPGRYHMSLDMPSAPGEPTALMLTHLSLSNRIWVNGTPLSTGPPDTSLPPSPSLVFATLVPVPANVLRAGTNDLLIETSPGPRAGLSQVLFGPLAAMQAQLHRHLLLDAFVPLVLSAASTGLALLLMAIWWRRRSEAALGAFGLLSLLISLRSDGYYLMVALGSNVLGDWFFYFGYLTHPWSAVLLALFAQRFSGVSWPRFSQALTTVALLLSLVGIWAISAGHSAELRRMAHPLILLLTLPSLWLCVRHARSLGHRALLMQVLAIGALIVSNVHDFVLQTLGWLPVTHAYWVPYTIALTVICVSLVLVQRIVLALGRVESVASELEVRVAQRTRELEEANVTKTRFLAIASHDLQQPLTAIGLLVAMARDMTSPAPMGMLLSKVDKAVAAMQNLLAGLLDVSRLDSGAVAVRLQSVRLASLFEAIQVHESASAAHKGLTLRVRATGAVVRSDPVLLETILRNLVSNAVRYTDRGGVLMAARNLQDGRVSIEVWDTGIGIAAADQDRAFEAFTQIGATSTESARGLGLGLAIVQRSVQLLGHELRLRSAPGRGSRFAILVPRAGAFSQQNAPTAVRAGTEVPAPPRQSPPAYASSHSSVEKPPPGGS